MTTSVVARPYLKPVYEYDIASIIGTYIPYVFEPNMYRIMLTIVATIVMAMSSSSVCLETPLSKIHCVKEEYSI